MGAAGLAWLGSPLSLEVVGCVPAAVIGSAEVGVVVGVRSPAPEVGGCESSLWARVVGGSVGGAVWRMAGAAGVGEGSMKWLLRSLMNSVAVRELVSSMVVKTVSLFSSNGIVCVVVVK